MNPLLRLSDCAFGYEESGTLKPVIQAVFLTVSTGEFVVLEGVNGSGKTTLLRGILGRVPLLSGSIDWNMALGELGYIPQESTLDADVPATALDVVMTAGFGRWPENRKESLSALDQVGLSDKAHVRFGSLSGGQKRRTLLARALAGSPKLLILDEPTVNVDHETEASLESTLIGLCCDKGTAVLAVTHAARWATGARRLHIRNGGLHE